MKKVRTRISTLVIAVIMLFGSTVLPNSILSANALSAFAPEIFTGSLASETDVQVYSVDVDFTQAASFAFCLIRTGDTGLTATIKDESGITVSTLTVYGSSTFGSMSGKRWVEVTRPSQDKDVFTYTIEVSLNNNYTADSSFCIKVGDYTDLEVLLCGRDCSVPITKYTNYNSATGLGGNYIYENFIPNYYESWFRFTPYSDTVFTLYSSVDNLRFRIYDKDDVANGLTTPVYDSDSDPFASRVDIYSGITTYVQKLKLSEHPVPGLTFGKEYYLVVYTPEYLRQSITNFSKTYKICVGEAIMQSNSVTVYSQTSITGTTTAFSPSALISVTGVPNSAVVYKASAKSATAGVTMSKIGTWRIKRADQSLWQTSAQFSSNIDIPYTYGSSLNSKLLGDWQFSFKPSSSSLTFVPGVLFYYYYELGD